MGFDIVKYIGDSAKRILTTKDLADIGATEQQLKSLSGNSVLTFVKGVAHEVETGLAEFIANHPALSGEFHKLSADEAADEPTVVNPISEGAAPGSSEPAGTPVTPPTAEASTSTAETSTTESAAPAEPSPSTSTVDTPPTA